MELSSWTEHILIVDDDLNLLSLMQRYMSSFGLQADVAENGKEAVKLLEDKSYGVVITDMMMPEMDGMALLGYASQNHPKTDVLVISGYSAIYSFTDIIKAGAVDFIAKPFEKDELKAKLQRIYRERRLIKELQNEIAAREREFLLRMEEEEKLRAITSAASDAIIVLDRAGQIIFWNQAAEHIFGYSAREAMERNILSSMVPDRFYDTVHLSLQQIQCQKGSYVVDSQLEFMGCRKNGEEFPVEVALAGVEIKGTCHALWLLKDITKRKAVEEELLKAKAEAEVASRAKSDFMNTISHELRTPMNGIVGFGTLLNATGLNAKQQEYLDLIHKSADRLMGLISQLLNFASLEACKKDLHPANFTVHEFFTSVLAPFRPKALEKGVKLTCEVADDIPETLYGDHVVVQQIMTNILDNAIKYTDQGFVAVRARKQQETADELVLEVAIADSGCSIPKAKQSMIFEAFSQVEEYSTRRHQGAGLGLAIAARLVKLLAGDIWLESAEGKGATFYFTVKLRRAKDDGEQGYERSAS